MITARVISSCRRDVTLLYFVTSRHVIVQYFPFMEVFFEMNLYSDGAPVHTRRLHAPSPPHMISSYYNLECNIIDASQVHYVTKNNYWGEVYSSLVPRPFGGGEKRAWYTQTTHASVLPRGRYNFESESAREKPSTTTLPKAE